MGNVRARTTRFLRLSAIALTAGLLVPGTPLATGAPPATADNQPTPIIDGAPYVGAELRRQYDYSYWGCRNPEGEGDAITLEWLRDGDTLPEERQGETLRILPEDQGSRISMRVHPLTPGNQGCPTGTQLSAETLPVKASTRAMGWTGRGNFEPLARTDDGRLVLYPRTYTYYKGMCEGPCPAYWGSWDEPRQVGQGWNVFDVVFSPGDFDGDGFNDLLGRDATGKLFLYPGDGEGGWLDREQVGQGWNVFNTIVGPGDFNGDGTNDVLARDAAGGLFLYPGDGDGGWLDPEQVGWGWQVMNKIITGGDMNADGAVDIFGRDQYGNLHQYPSDGEGGWEEPAHVGVGWESFSQVAGIGSSGHSKYNELSAVDANGNLLSYITGASNSGLYGPYGPIGRGWNVFKELL
ncbi:MULTISPECIES: VCBS repeat-containing protein [unclassified Arthrobacter]|uniref:FG-GAP repeat domain-containing protein n=1 Tax=unclassified Arthrobacter TaxID=235627 RepID=UPI0028830563|nr:MULTISPECIES: VCBS repeat-containing protein [unclassified Arthrobacter]